MKKSILSKKSLGLLFSIFLSLSSFNINAQSLFCDIAIPTFIACTFLGSGLMVSSLPWKNRQENQETAPLIDHNPKRRILLLACSGAFCLTSFIAWGITYKTCHS